MTISCHCRASLRRKIDVLKTVPSKKKVSKGEPFDTLAHESGFVAPVHFGLSFNIVEG